MRSVKIVFTLITILCIKQFGYSQSTTVEFRVNMNYQVELGNFSPENQFVDIAGTFNEWGATPNPMTDGDADGIYSVSISLPVGEVVGFKCRIDGLWDGNEEFPNGGPNRTYTVEEDGVVEFWYNDELPSYILNVSISSSAVYAEVGETINFFDTSSGNPVEWSWEFPGGTPSTSTLQNPLVTYASQGEYSVTLTITNADNDQQTKTFTNYIKVGETQVFWWNDAVFYEVFVRSFYDSNSDGKGDIQGLIQKLDYLNDGDPNTDSDLGVTGIWLMPIMQSPSYHGYDATDYRTVEQDYGSNADFVQLINEAHARGIKVIIDLVMNHTSNQHSWFVESTNNESDKRDWYVWSDTNPGFSGPWGQTVWHYSNGSYFYGLFWSGMPDLNYNTQAVKDEMFDIARFWLEDMNVDGFRLDAVKYIYEDGEALENLPETIQFWKDFRSYYKSVKPDAFSVGEAWASTQVVMPYVNDDALDYCFEFELAEALVNGVISGNAANLKQTVNSVLAAYPYMQFGTFLTNHDMNRIMSVLDEDEEMAKLSASLLLTLPGIPYIYYGEEIGMTGVKPDEYIRTPMQWSSNANAGFTQGTPWITVNSDYTIKNVEAQKADPNSLWNHYRKLISIRNDNLSLRQGNYKPVQSSNSSVFAFVRQHADELILVVSNLGDAQVASASLTVPIIGISAGDYSLFNQLGGNHQSITIAGDELYSIAVENLDAKSTRIFKLQEPTSSALNNQLPSLSVEVFPNPASEQLNVEFSTRANSISYRVIDLYGREHKSGVITSNGLAGIYPINTSSLPSGFYLIRFSSLGAQVVKKVVIH